LFLQGAAGEVQRLVGQFPPAWLAASARLLRLSGLAHCLRWQWGEMAQRMAAAERAAAAANDADELHLALAYLSLACYPLGRNDESEACLERLRGLPVGPHARVVVLLGECTQHFRRGEHDQVPALYAELVAGLERHGSLFTWWECAPAASWSTLRGIRPVLQRYFAGALARLGERALPMRVEVQVHQALASLWGGEIERAMAQVAAAESDMKWLACSADTEVTARIVHMLLDAAHGRAERLAQTLAGLIVREDTNPDLQRRRLWQHQVGVYGVRFSEALGSGAEALLHWAAYLNEQPLSPGSNADSPRANAVRARYAAAQGRWDEAAALFGSVLPHVGRMDTMGQAIELQLRAGHAMLQCGRAQAAAQAVVPALERLREEGERGHALMCGSAVLRQLADAAWGALLPPSLRAELGELAGWAERLRAASPSSAGAVDAGGDAAEAPRNAADTLLSAREREVLQLMAAGDSNKLIARALDISPHTVKRHVANILDKLDLPSRAAAGAWLQRHA
ncbi:MAG TPA: LuxR C-terminal-related transcriptional regulator, partial [Ideonella sp.]|nr:LuxR C-terminal-related transcriptional regulator [Ideonella sp.]